MAIYLDRHIVYFHCPISLQRESFAYGLRLIHRYQIDLQSPILIVSLCTPTARSRRIFPPSKLFDEMVRDSSDDDDESEYPDDDDVCGYAENDTEIYPNGFDLP